MTTQRVRELRVIAAHLYGKMMENMESQDIRAGAEETVVLAEVAHKIVADVAVWTFTDHTGEEE